MTVLTDNLAARVFSAAKTEGNAFVRFEVARAATIALITDALAGLDEAAYVIVWANSRGAYIEGRLCAASGLKQADAASIIGLKPFTDKKVGVAGYRTKEQHDMVRAAEKHWNRLASQAEIVNPDKRGGARLPKTPVDAPVTAPTNNAKVALNADNVRIEKCADNASVVVFMGQLAAMLSRFENENAKVLTLDTRHVIECFIAGTKALTA
jgi:hypothetical protein